MKYSIKEIGKVLVENDQGIRHFGPLCMNTVGYGTLKYYGDNNTEYLNKPIIFKIEKDEFSFEVVE